MPVALKEPKETEAKIQLSYEPGEKQREFHVSPSKYRLYLGAWRAGKTYAGVFEALRHSLMYPGNEGLILRKDYTDLLNTTYVTFCDLCPPELIKRESKSPTHIIELINGSLIHFSGVKDRGSLGSYELGWFYCDEADEIDEGIFTYLKGRLNRVESERKGWLTSNPPNKDHWLYRLFVEEATKDFAVIYASTYDNRAYLTPDYIESLENMPESWRKKYLHGQWGFTPDGKPFYSGFDERLHKQKLSYIPGKRIFRGIDFGFHHPSCVWVQRDQNDRLMVLLELMGTDVTIDKFADMITARENEVFRQGENTYVTYCDPAGSQKNDKSEKTSIEILRTKGFNPLSKQTTYRERKELVERLLNGMTLGTPNLIVHEGCGTIIDGFLGGYHYPEQKENRPVPEAPEKDGYYEHLMNALEYIIVNLYTIRPQITEQERKKRVAHYQEKMKKAVNLGFGE